MALYLEAALDDGDPALVSAVIGDARLLEQLEDVLDANDAHAAIERQTARALSS